MKPNLSILKNDLDNILKSADIEESERNSLQHDIDCSFHLFIDELEQFNLEEWCIKKGFGKLQAIVLTKFIHAEILGEDNK